MSSCLSGGGRSSCGLDLEIISHNSPTSTSSPSSTISESSNSPNTISTRKPRAARKRPNQKYNEAAALLSTACPNIFSTKHLLKPCSKLSKTTIEFSSLEEAEESAAQLLLHHPFPAVTTVFDEKPNSQYEPRLVTNSPQNQLNCAKFGGHNNNNNNNNEYDGQGGEDDFDAESILDEEIEGIDSIMGSMIVRNEDECNGPMSSSSSSNLCYGYPFRFSGGLGFNFGFGFGSRRVSAFRGTVDQGGGGGWCSFPIVNVGQIISPTFEPKQQQQHKKKKKKKKKVEDIINANANANAVGPNTDSNFDSKTHPSLEDSALNASNSPQLVLKLNYDDVLNAWSARGSPFSHENHPRIQGMDTASRLAQIDLFGENGGVGGVGTGIGGIIREASVQRYKEKRRTRLFSKKIRYQVRKVNADQRPRMKGRFVRTPDTIGTPNQKKRTKSRTKS
ncbi:hypothetical protein Dimus_025670 [Dionaea muscipula]